jgi:lipopolysaccharide heptosyltransferase II
LALETPMRKILVIRLSSLGDIILTSPATLNLKLRYPEAEICFLTKEQFADIASALPGVERVLTIPSHAKLREIYWRSLKLDDERFDLIVDLSANARSRFMTALISGTTKVTYSKRRLLRERIVRRKRLNSPAPHTTESYNRVLRKIDPKFPLSAKRPLIDKAFYQDGASLLSGQVREWLESKETFMVIAPGARHETKRAPLELFRTCCDKLISESPLRVVSVIQSPEAELSLKQEFSSQRFAEVVDAPLRGLTFVLRRAEVTLTNDSAVAHLSSAVGTPVVALFGPTHSALGFSPRGIYDKVIENDEDCRPCSLHGSRACVREERYCFTRLTVGEITQAVTETIELQRKLSPALFLDRDGVLIEEKYFLSDPSQVVFYDNAFENLRRARRAGYKLVIVTNQSGVARGMMSQEDVSQVNERVIAGLAENGIQIDACYTAPGHPDGVIERFRTADNSRKPSEEMFVSASREHRIDLRRSWIIGDRATDYLSARTIGARGGALVETGYGKRAMAKLPNFGRFQPDLIAPDLAGAISAILEADSLS